MPEIHLRQRTALGKPGFTYTACGPFIKERKNKKKEIMRRKKE